MLAIANITRSSQYPTGLINVYCSNLKSENFKIILDYYATAEETANAYWLFIGKVQQWGFSPYNAGPGLVSIELPLSSSEIISVCSQQIAQSATDKNGSQQVLFVSFDETSINFRIVNTEATTDTAVSFYWFGLFKQQWGLTEEAYLPTIDFPVSFTSIPAVVGTPIKDYATSENYFGNNSIESVTASSFVPRQTNTNGGTKAGAIRYIAVGY